MLSNDSCHPSLAAHAPTAAGPRGAAAAAIALVVLAAPLAGCNDFRDCSTEDASAAAELPALLSETGLYADLATDAIADSAIEFAPRYPLWTDGATKRRWLLLPDDGRVDTSDPNDWVFPVGTRFFKEFNRDGVRVETRMNERLADGWTAAAYIWDADGADAQRVLETTEDVGGTGHDVPGAAECLACHAGRRNFTLGFSATQLEPEVRQALFEDGVFTAPVTADVQLPPAVEAGLGVLHGNCSHCHNGTRDQQPQATVCYAPPVEEDDDPLDLSLPADLASLDEAPVVLTGRFLLGQPGDSQLLDRMSSRTTVGELVSMPPLGTELIDEDGVDAVEALIGLRPSEAAP